MKVLDTDTCVEILRGNLKVMERRVDQTEEVVTTWMTAGELYFGAACSRDPLGNRSLVEQFLRTLPVIGMDRRTADVFGETKAALQRAGEVLPDADVIIGAIVLARGAVIVTGNRARFERLPGIRIEDWIRPGARRRPLRSS